MNPIVYFFLALTAVLATTANAGGPVLDINGDFIFRGSFYVLPVVRGRGGGVTLAGRGAKPCPLDIVQARSEVDNGIPVKFSNWKSRVGFVPESADLNIETNIGATICVQSTYWWVGELDKVSKKRFIVAGPKPEGFGEESLKSFFQIKKVENPDAYKFVFCSKKCIDVGIFIDGSGVRRLTLSSKPFLVQFKKANVTEEDSSKTMSIISM